MKAIQALKVLKRIREMVSKFEDKDIPDTCGACGTPAAQCDTNCMDAAYAAEHNRTIDQLDQLIVVIDNRIKMKR